MPRDPGQVQKAEESGLRARFQAVADQGVEAAALSPAVRRAPPPRGGRWGPPPGGPGRAWPANGAH